MEVGKKDDKGVQAQNPNQETRGRSCKGCLYHSSILKSKSQNPRCVGISRTLQQGPSLFLLLSLYLSPVFLVDRVRFRLYTILPGTRCMKYPCPFLWEYHWSPEMWSFRMKYECFNTTFAFHRYYVSINKIRLFNLLFFLAACGLWLL